MTNSKDDDQQAEEEEENYSQIKVKSKNRPSSIHIQQRDWSDIQVMNQIMTPVRILSDTDLHQEFDFYANAQFKNSNNPVSTPTSLSANTYFDYHRNQQPPPRQRSATMFQNSSTPQFNIPSDANDFTSSSYQVPTPSSTSSPTNPGSVLQNRQSLNNLSLYFEEQQHQTTSSEANKTALLLAHEPGMFGREIASQTTRGMLNGNNNALYSDQSMSLSSGPNSPITSNGYNHQLETYFEKQDHQLPKNLQSNSDRFEAMFLSSTPPSQDLDTKEKPLTPTKRPAQRTQKQQQFRFKKSPSQNTAAAAASTGTTAPSQNQHPLDFLVLSRHNMEIELATTAAFSSANPSSAGSKRKSKQKAPANSKKALGKKPSTIMENTTSSYDRQHSDSDNDDHDEDEDELNGEDAPVFGDGAQSYSSMGSSSSRTSQQTLTKDDKRRRNTAASARFRIKKKMREQALQSTACEMTDKAQRMEQRVHELEREIKWLKALVVEKNEARLEQLVRERPPNSTAFPMPLSQSYQQQQQQQQENHLHQQQQQQQQQSNGSRRISRNSRQRSTKNEDYENEDDRPYQNDQY